MWSCVLAESIRPLTPRFPFDMLRYMNAVVHVGTDILILLFSQPLFPIHFLQGDL